MKTCAAKKRLAVQGTGPLELQSDRAVDKIGFLLSELSRKLSVLLVILLRFLKIPCLMPTPNSLNRLFIE